MMNRKRVFWATTALFTGLLAAGAASAQSSGTVAAEAETRVEDVVVTGVRGPRNVEGLIVAETVTKTRSSITQEYIDRQQAGQTILQSLNLVPGLNFTNSDPYGSSGGNIRLRGFDGNRISLTFDGIPLNDTGNYAVFTNQQLDPELIDIATVNQGTTDVDSPTASATGGTINYRVARPYAEPSVQARGTLGTDSYGRIFIRADTGEFGPWGTTAYAAVSYQKYDKFRGPGELEKRQFNGRIYQDLGNGNFASLSGHFNRNRNAFYNTFVNQAQFAAGTALENDIACFRPTAVNGTAQNESTSSTFIRSDGSVGTGSCTNAHTLRINPSNTGNIRGQFSYKLTDAIRFTFDPSYQFVMANGGGFTAVSERDDRLDLTGGNTGGPGVDLNGDADTLDTVTLYTPNNTNTNRYGLISSLLWDINDDNRFRIAYTYDYGRHRQTGEWARVTQDARPFNVFAANRLYGDPGTAAVGIDGSRLRGRDRASIAQLNQISADYRLQLLDDAVQIDLGVRAPFFERQLNQFCFSQNASSTVRCTTETPTSTLANGNVTFNSTGTTQWIRPYSVTLKYDDVLPNVGARWRFAENQTVYISYAESLSAPRTDNLYQPVRLASGGLDFSQVVPETTQSYDLGYRFNDGRSQGQIALWYNKYQDRIVSSFDNDPASPFFGQSVDRNVGAVELMGVDSQVGFQATDTVSVYLSASYNDSELQSDLPLSTTTFLPTKGKKLVETPEWTFGGRVSWDVTEELALGFQGKWVDARFATDVNDEIFPSYSVFDFDARYDLTQRFGIKDAYIQLNVSNIFDEDYQGNISTGNNATNIDVDPGPGVVVRAGQVRTGSYGAPRAVLLTLNTRF